MFKVKLFFLIFSLLALFSFNLKAQEQFDDLIEEIIPKTKLTNDQLKHLRAELRIQKILIEGVKQIELNGGKFTNIEKTTNTLQDLIYETIGAKSKTITNEALDHVQDIVKDGINKNALKSVIQKTRDFAFNFTNNKKIFMSSVARRFGFDVGLVYIASLQVDLTIPLVMIANGHPQYAVLLATPVSSIATASYAAVKSAVKYRQVVKSLGGIQNSLHHLNIFREMKTFFNQKIIMNYDIIDMNIAGKNFALTIERQNLVSKVFSKFGWNKNLNYENLLKVLEENEFMTEFVQKVKSSDRVAQVKMIRLLNKIESINDPTIMSALKDKFGKFINEIDGLPEFSSQRTWAINLAQSTSFDDFIKTLARIPDDIPPRVLDKVWRNYILIEASKNIAPSMSKSNYLAFRRLYDDYTNIRGDFTNSIDYKMDDLLRGKFSDYIYDALGTVGICNQLYQKKTPSFTPFL